LKHKKQCKLWGWCWWHGSGCVRSRVPTYGCGWKGREITW